ncbi:MAG: LCP family protein [Anaerolineaceae bacterium]|nr:LCP family protein [Anaerolineaceae bacterium]
MRKTIFWLTLLGLLIHGCAYPAPTVEPNNKIARVLVTNHPDSTPTRTPFHPLALTFTPTITATPTITFTPTPTPTINTPTPTPWDNGLVKPVDQVNILLLGSDFRPNAGYRTDVILLVSINPQPGTVNVVSFPRDLYVNIPGVGMERINTAMAYGGFWTMAETFEQNFFVRPDYFMMTNFDGFKNIINILDGIHIQAATNLTDRCDVPGTSGTCSIGPGHAHIDGDMALWYVRSRYSTSDFSRTKRAQEVVQAIFERLMSLDAVARAPELYNTFRNSVETNMDKDVILPLISVAPALTDSSRINSWYIGPAETTSTITAGGAWVLIPNQYAIQNIIRQAIYGQ